MLGGICFVIFCCITITNTVYLPLEYEETKSELALINVVFRHGDRTPTEEIGKLFSNVPYDNSTIFPHGFGQLTNNGKRRSYRFGKILRRRYEAFLSRVYLQKEVKARSTFIIRSKMSLLLALAGLYPPARVQRWNTRLNWQPINTIYLPADQDGLLLAVGCPLYKETLEKVMKYKEVQSKIDQFKNVVKEVSLHTGQNVTFWNLFPLYHDLAAARYVGHRLPSWTNDMFPNGALRDVTALVYRIGSYNNVLKRRNGGVLLHRMIQDMEKVINGTSDGRKINLYCAHDITIAAALSALGLYDDQIPEYCSAVIVELRVKAGKYYVKVLYHLGIPEKTIELTIPGCEELCPFEKFFELRKHAIAKGDDLLCDKPEPLQF